MGFKSIEDAGTVEAPPRRGGFRPLAEAVAPSEDAGTADELNLPTSAAPAPVSGGLGGFVKDLVGRAAGVARDVALPGLKLGRDVMDEFLPKRSVMQPRTTEEEVLGISPDVTLTQPKPLPAPPPSIGPAKGKLVPFGEAGISDVVRELGAAADTGATRMAIEAARYGNIAQGDMPAAYEKDALLKQQARDEFDLRARTMSGGQESTAIKAAQALPQSLAYMGGFAAGGMPGAALVSQPMIVDQYVKHRENGNSPIQSLLAAQGAVASEVIPERFGWHFLTKIFKLPATATKAQVLRAIGVQQVGEHAEEQITNLSEFFIDRMMNDPTATPQQLLADAKETAQVTAFLAPAFGGGAVAAHAVPHLARKVEEIVSPGRAVGRAMQETLDEREHTDAPALVSALRRTVDGLEETPRRTPQFLQPQALRGEEPTDRQIIPQSLREQALRNPPQDEMLPAPTQPTPIRQAVPVEELGDEDIPKSAFATQVALDYYEPFKKATGKYPWEMPFEQFFKNTVSKLKAAAPGKPLSWYEGVIRSEWEKARQHAPRAAFNTQPTLGLSRKDMPQIRARDHADFERFAADKGSPVTREQVAVSSLSPAQNEVAAEQVAQLPDEALAKPLLVSADDYILDGTNRWARMNAEDPDRQIPVIRVPLPAREAIALMKSFPRAMRKDVGEVGATEDVVRERVRKVLDRAIQHQADFENLVLGLANEEDAGTIIVPPKGITRATAKVLQYNGDAERLRDANRSSIVVNDPDQANRIASKVNERATPLKPILPYGSNAADGFKVINVQIKQPWGPVEMQINTPEMIEAQMRAHKIYEARDALVRRAEDERRELTDDELAVKDILNENMKQLFTEADQRAQERVQRGQNLRGQQLTVAGKRAQERGSELAIEELPKLERILSKVNLSMSVSPEVGRGPRESLRPLGTSQAVTVNRSLTETGMPSKSQYSTGANIQEGSDAVQADQQTEGKESLPRPFYGTRRASGAGPQGDTKPAGEAGRGRRAGADRNAGKSAANPITSVEQAVAFDKENPPKKNRVGQCHTLSWQKVVYEGDDKYKHVIGVTQASPSTKIPLGSQLKHFPMKIWHSVALDPQTGNVWEPISNRWYSPGVMTTAFGYEPVASVDADTTRKLALKAKVYTDQTVIRPQLKGANDTFLQPGDYDAHPEIFGPADQTATPEFKRWFGESKVVDENGKPLVVYHGTVAPENFDEFLVGETPFDLESATFRTGSGGDPTTFLGSHFSKERSVASRFAKGIYGERAGKKHGGRVMPVFLKLENPYVITELEMIEQMKLLDLNNAEVDAAVEQYAQQNSKDVDDVSELYEKDDADVRYSVNQMALEMERDQEEPTFDTAREMAEKYRSHLEGLGHDGIVYKNMMEGGTSYVAFRPEQIKSAVGNSGAFDPEQKSILKTQASSAREEAPDRPAQPGEKILVYRVAKRPTLDNSNAGNAEAIARHLANYDDEMSARSGSGIGNMVFAFEVTVPPKWDRYEGSTNNKQVSQPGKTVVGNQIAYSFPEGAQVRLVGEMPLDQVRERLKARGLESFDDAGIIEGAKAIRDAMQGEFHIGTVSGTIPEGSLVFAESKRSSGASFKEMGLKTARPEALGLSSSLERFFYRELKLEEMSAVADAVEQLVAGGMPIEIAQNVKGYLAFSSLMGSHNASYIPFNGTIVFNADELKNAGTPVGKRFLLNYLAHELNHHVDRGPIAGGDTLPSQTAARVKMTLDASVKFQLPQAWSEEDRQRYIAANAELKLEGDLAQEIGRVMTSGPQELKDYFAYPMEMVAAGAMPADMGSSELVAQVGSIYLVKPETVKKYLPAWYSVMEKTYGSPQNQGNVAAPESFGEAHRRLQLAIQEPRAVEQGEERGDEGIVALSREADTGSSQRGPPGERMGFRSQAVRGATPGAPVGGRTGGRGAAAGPASPAWSIDEPGLIENLRREWQDNKIDLKATQEAIEKAGGVLRDDNSAYLAEELYHGKVSALTKNFFRNVVEPMLKEIRDSKVTIEEVGKYLWARHAKERNAQMARINPGGPANLSGLYDTPAAAAAAGQPGAANASDILIDFSRQRKLTALTSIAQKIDAITKSTRQLLIREGLESASTISAWEGVYKNYVPLFRDAEDAHAGGAGFTVKGPESKRAMGSQKEALAIVAAVIAQHEKAIVRAEKAKVGRSLIKLAEDFPNPSFWKVDQPPMKRSINPTTGLVQNTVDPQYKLRPDVFVVKDKDPSGAVRERVITFNPGDERAMKLAAAMKNLDVVQLGALTKVVGKVTRILANLATSWNPGFWVTNAARDVQTMAVNLQSTPLNGHAPQVISQIPQAISGIMSAEFKNGTGKWATLYREFEEDGGKTGWMSLFENLIERQDELNAEIKASQRGNFNPVKWGAMSLDVVDKVNGAIENATRLAAYAEARSIGMSRARSASLAKNLTVNFNRKGNRSTATNAWYMFVNANVQGTARLVQALGKSPKAMAIVGVMTAFAGALELLNRLIGDKDRDEDGNNPYELIPEYVKQKNMIFMIPGSGGKYGSVPLPYGFNVFHNAGRMMMEGVLTATNDKHELVDEKKKPLSVAWNFAQVLIDAFMPLGQASSPGQLISPTVLDPLVQYAENKTWFGAPMRPEPLPFDKATPNHKLFFRSTSDTAKDISKWLSDATGGDDVKGGSIDISPTTLTHVFKSITGGTGAFGLGMFDFTAHAVGRITGEKEPEDLPWKGVPFVGKFFGEVDDREKASKFYRLRNDALEVMKQVKQYRKMGEDEKADRLEEEKPALVALAREVADRQFTKDMKGIRDTYKEIDQMPRDERKQARKDLKVEESTLIGQALRAYNEGLRSER